MDKDERGITYVGNLLTNLVNLNPVDFEHLKTFWGFEDHLNKLQQSLLSIAHIVEDAEHKQHTMADARSWLRNLKKVAYEADDLLSQLAYETRAMVIVRKAKFCHKMAHKLKKVNPSLQNIQRLGISIQLSSIQHNMDNLFRFPTDSVIDDSIVGRKIEVAKIVNLLTSSCYQQLTVVSIIGMEGIGKTTLAKLVCQKVMALTRKPFDVKIWVYVTQHYTEHKILGAMLQSVNASMGGLTNEDAVLRQLRKELARKKFLLVLDGVWNEDDRRWDRLKTLLSRICTNNGNAILVTSSYAQVASMSTSSQHSLQLNSLSDDDCRFILKESAFRNVITPVPSNLEAIGKEIAKRCRGIPLIAKLLGGIMGFNMDEKAWLKIRDCFILIVESIELDYISTIELIFRNLPSYLNSCLVFCSNFTNDLLIRKEELIWLWMAEGIVESCHMGNKCFDALLASS